MMQLKWKSSSEFRRYTWGVLWRISHVHEVSYILWENKTGKETGIRGYFVLKANADLEHLAGCVTDILKLRELLQYCH